MHGGRAQSFLSALSFSLFLLLPGRDKSESDNFFNAGELKHTYPVSYPGPIVTALMCQSALKSQLMIRVEMEN